MTRKKKADRNREISGIVYLAFALFFAFAFYLPQDLTGWIGRTAIQVFRGVTGVVSYVFPVFFLYLAIESFKEKRVAIRRQRYTYTFICILCLSALFHIFTVNQTAFRGMVGSADKPALEAVKAFWEIGIHPDRYPGLGDPVLGGGVAGGLAATALYAIGGRVGAPLLLIAVVIIQIILIFDVSLRHAAGSARSAIQVTGTRLNDALRERVRVLRERAAQSAAESAARSEARDETEEVVPRFDHRMDDSDDSVPSGDGTYEPIPDEVPIRHVTGGDPVPEPVRGEVPQPVGFGNAFIDLPEELAIEEDGPVSGDNDAVLPAGIVHIGLPGSKGKKPGARSHTAGSTEGRPVPAGSHAEDGHAAEPEEPREAPYQSPPSTLLNPGRASNAVANAITVNSLGRKLEETLASFGIAAKVSNITSGPSITRFELIPGPGIKVSRIVSLTDDIALNLAAVGVRIEAPIPGKSAIGVEIPNKETSPVSLRGLIESPEFKAFPSRLCSVLGRDISGQPMFCDITRMPHLLIAGATGSGKSVCINALLMSVLFRAHPDEVKLILIDPKVVELSMYNGIPHLLVPVVTDPKKASNALIWAVNEMNNRYRQFSERSVRDIGAYNTAAPEGGFEKLPLILIIIDELADLMMTSPTEVEDAIARLTAMARAAGIHLVIATQRPSVDVITGVIKANIPSRIAFAVASQVDSRTILDMGGAEKLLGKGDMLYFPQSSPKPIRGQGAMVTDAEVETVIAFLKAQNITGYDQGTADAVVATPTSGTSRETQDSDELMPSAVEIVIEAGYASVSLLQRRMNVGYPRAARLIDRMQEAGYVGPFEGSKPRKVIISKQRWMEIQSSKEGS